MHLSRSRLTGLLGVRSSGLGKKLLVQVHEEFYAVLQVGHLRCKRTACRAQRVREERVQSPYCEICQSSEQLWTRRMPLQFCPIAIFFCVEMVLNQVLPVTVDRV